MQLEWRTVVKEDELWGWRLYDFDQKTMYAQFMPRAEVRLLLCRTKQHIKMWMYGVEVGRHRRMFYTEEEAKAWTIAIVRL